MQGHYNVLFLCTGNSARSIMAEAILNFKGRTNFTAYSAGSHPSGAVRQEALRQLEAAHIPTAGLRSKLWDEFSTGEEPRAKSRKPAASGWQLSYFLPSLFCAITNPRGVGNRTTEIRPSCSIFKAASRTVFKCELESCIRIRPLGLILGRKCRTSASRSSGSESENRRSMVPGTLTFKLDSQR